MATTQLSDIINVTVFQDLPAVDSPEKLAVFQSGAVVNSELLNQLADGAGKSAELPFWKDLDANDEPNQSTDNPNSKATPSKVSQEEQKTRKAFLNKGWSATDLANELALGATGIDQIRARDDTYWVRQWQRRLIASAPGVAAGNIASSSSDMVHDVAVDAVADQSVATRFSRQNFIDAAYTMGDRVDGITAMAVHSFVAKQMAEQGDVEDVNDADGKLSHRTYMGRTVIVDDSMPVIAGGTDGFKYLSMLFGGGAFGYGEGTPSVPVELERDASSADGGGLETLWTRKTWILHPFGYQHEGTPSKGSFTLAELRTAALWSRIVERKNVPLAFMFTN